LKGGKMKKLLIALVLMSVLTLSVSAFWPFTKASLSPPTFPSNTLSCEESDGVAGINTDVAGAIKYTYRQYGISKTNWVSDSCEGESIIEVYCAGKTPKSKVQSFDSAVYRCEAGQITAFGKTFNSAKLVPISTIPEVEIICSDSDAGLFPLVSGVVYGTDSQGAEYAQGDQCKSGNKINEVYCDEGVPTVSVGVCEGTCVTEDVIVNGNTYPSAKCQLASISCEENGYRLFATVDVAGTQVIKEDKCNGNRLTDYFCDPDHIGQFTSNTITCTDICDIETRTCVDRTAICSDSDAGGKDYTTKGTITTASATVEDFCYSDKGLVEFSCKDNSAFSKTDAKIYLKKMNCKNGCANGKCNSADATAE